MVPVMSLWMAIILAAFAVFVVSSIIHMALPYHRTDFKPVHDEDGLSDALRPFAIPPGDYYLPRPANPAAMKEPAFIERMNRGPVIVMTVMQNGMPSMGPQLALWFLYCVVVSLFAGYMAGSAVGAGGEYLTVFRFAGTTAFAGYGLALLQNSIWYKRNWSATLKSVFDALIYGLVTGGVFGWLWP